MRERESVRVGNQGRSRIEGGIDRDEEEGWLRVSGRKRRFFTTFFFSHFPDNFDAKAMWDVFKKYGNVKEVVIPNRRNRAGMRFRFVRLWDVVDCQSMERRLDNIIIGSTKLHVNIPRFQKGPGDKAQREVGAVPGGGFIGKKQPNANKGFLHGTQRQMNNCLGSEGEGGQRKSYKKALEEGRREAQSLALGINERNSGGSNQGIKGTIEVEEKVEQWLKESLVGVVRDVAILNNIQDMFILEGMNYVRVRYLGDCMVLLTGEEGANVREIWNQASDWLDEHFSSISPWKPEMVPSKRMIWVRCEGIPLHLWNTSFFENVTKEAGELVAVADETRSFKKIDAARLCLRTEIMESVFLHFKMQLNRNLYNIRLMEELDCYGSCNCTCKGFQSESEDSDDLEWSRFGVDTPPPSPDHAGGGDGGQIQNTDRQSDQGDAQGVLNVPLWQSHFSHDNARNDERNDEQLMLEGGPEVNDGLLMNGKLC